MPSVEQTQGTEGVFVTLADLIALRFAAKKLHITNRSRALNSLAGPNKSNFRGRGIDFEEVRRYEPGDDIRTIDWRVTARSGNPHTKLFREERERPVLIFVDQCSGMYFGSSTRFKSVLAANIAATIAWAALDQGERVGGFVFNQNGHKDIRPQRSKRSVLMLLSEIVRYNNALPVTTEYINWSLGGALLNLRRIARPGTSIFLISDFLGSDSDYSKENLFKLSQHNEVTAILCTDPLEHVLPIAGRYAVTDGLSNSNLDTGNEVIRLAYEKSAADRIKNLDKTMSKLGIPLLRATTNKSELTLLQSFYGKQKK